jgi:hypothetical protein
MFACTLFADVLRFVFKWIIKEINKCKFEFEFINYRHAQTES